MLGTINPHVEEQIKRCLEVIENKLYGKPIDEVNEKELVDPTPYYQKVLCEQ